MKKTWAIILAVIAFDQLVKWFMLFHVGMESRPPIEVTSFFRLVMVWNKGISFGMLNQGQAFMPWLLVALALGISAWLLNLAYRSASAFERAAYALIIGGALGNVIDRARFGAVADFFYFHLGELGWPAFNIADSAICIGVLGLLLQMVRHPTQS
jgi:signal peptidase II